MMPKGQHWKDGTRALVLEPLEPLGAALRDGAGVVEPALVRALALAADAGRLDLVSQLVDELVARRAKPDHAVAQALADAVLRGLRAGDLVVSRAAARALSVMLDTLADAAAAGGTEGPRDLHAGRSPRGGAPE